VFHHRSFELLRKGLSPRSNSPAFHVGLHRFLCFKPTQQCPLFWGSPLRGTPEQPDEPDRFFRW
jgi:hypothetical protein